MYAEIGFNGQMKSYNFEEYIIQSRPNVRSPDAQDD